MPKPTDNHLAEENRALKNKIKKLEQSVEKLQDSEQVYRALFEHAGFSIVLLNGNTGEIVLFNNKAYETLEYTEDEFKTLSLLDIDKDGPHDGMELNMEEVKKRGARTFRARHRTKNNAVRHMLISSVSVDIKGEIFHQDIGSDITDLVMMEKELKAASADLERRVAERTQALLQKTENLREMNSALNILLKKRDTDKKDLEENVMKNIKELVDPYVQLLKQGDPGERHKNYLEIMESNLNDITSPFSKKLSDKLLNLSPAEIKVANLIMLGHTTKEIALQLLLSDRTIEAHRNRIRKKVGLTNKKISLQTYLQSL